MTRKQNSPTHWHVVRNRPQDDGVEILCHIADPRPGQNRCIAYTRGRAYHQARSIPKSGPNEWPRYPKPFHVQCHNNSCSTKDSTAVSVFVTMERERLFAMQRGI